MSINDEHQIEGAENEQQEDQEQKQSKKTERPAGAPEGRVEDEPSSAEIKELYEATGVTAPVPTGKSKGRPKTTDVRAKSDKKDPSGSADSGEKGKNADDKNKSKDASASDKDGDSGNKADSKGSKDGKDAGELQDKSGASDGGVRKTESAGEGDSERGGEKDSERGTERAGQEEHDKGGEAEKTGDDEENIKRPGKSNPEVEKRMQRLAADRKEALERAERAEKALQESARKQAQEKVSQEDPEYTVDDFRKVRDNKTGEIKELDPEQAELAWRRWKDGYDQRATERQARENYEADRVQRAEATTKKLMEDSVAAYDALAALQNEYPELVRKNPDGSINENFDEDFAAEVMPILEEAIEYLPGTEPGNANDKLPIIVGLRIDPKKILAAMKGISNKKRNLPLNGVNDSVDSGSNVSVPHSRSSDPNVNAANELYKELGINKRI